MKTRFASAVVLLAAIECLQAPTPSAAQSLTRPAGADVPSTASTAPMYPVPRTLFAEVIARFSIGATHRAIYANITGNQMWFIVQSQFGRPNAQSAIDERSQTSWIRANAFRSRSMIGWFTIRARFFRSQTGLERSSNR